MDDLPAESVWPRELWPERHPWSKPWPLPSPPIAICSQCSRWMGLEMEKRGGGVGGEGRKGLEPQKVKKRR